MNAQELHDLMLAYVAGCADDAECQHMEIWLASGDISAHAAYAEALAVLHAVPLAIDPIQPPSHIRVQVLKRCGGKTRSLVPFALFGVTAIAACLAVALGLSLAGRRGATTSPDGDATQWQAMQRVMASPDVTFAKMDVVPVSGGGSTTAKGAYGRVLYCPQTRQYEVHVFDLAPPPPGRVYELWLITPDKKPIPAGTFTLKSNRSGMILATLPPTTTAIMAAITDEPQGGSQTPTGKMQLTGALAG